MSEDCCAHDSAGKQVCELPLETEQRPKRFLTNCPKCNEKGRPVQGQTVKALLSVTLRHVENIEYLFCRSQTCPVVYFSADGGQAFTVDEVRELVYQKEPTAEQVLICYCFFHKVGDLRHGTSTSRQAVLDDINAGIQSDKCACDLRNPQGSCCLGNVRALIKELDTTAGE